MDLKLGISRKTFNVRYLLCCNTSTEWLKFLLNVGLGPKDGPLFEDFVRSPTVQV